MALQFVKKEDFLINSFEIINHPFEKKIQLDNCIPYKFQIEQRLSVKIKLVKTNQPTKQTNKKTPKN